LSVGLAAVVWVPLLFGLGAVMITVWAARRRRQRLEGRGSSEIRDPTHAEQPWPKSAIDDRLPER